MSQKEQQEKMMTFRIMEARMEELSRSREALAARMANIENTIASIDELSKAKGDFSFHLGDGIFFPAKTAEGKVMVTVGADVAMERTLPEARKMLETRKAEAIGAIGSMQKEMEDLSKKMEVLMHDMGIDHAH